VTIWAIVPVKPFNHAKSRLATVLSAREREALSRSLLEHTLGVLAEVPEIERVLVVSRDTEALTLARGRGAHTVTESGAPELNSALTRATQAAISFGARTILVLPIDLPLLRASDIKRLLELDGQERAVVISPDRREVGTNALVVRPPLLMDYAFGPDSCRVHAERAAAAGAQVHVCRLPGTGLDVDEPADLELYRALAPQAA
jgi:2-phospho-L-lactate guanylyltransferase